MKRLACLALLPFLLGAAASGAEPIDTAFIERPWKNQLTRELEVGRHTVHWRQRGSRKDGIFAGMRYVVPLDQQRTWDLANAYSDVGANTQGIQSVTITQESPTRQTVRVALEVLWVKLVLIFEVEQIAPEIVRFRMSNPSVGRYAGYCRFRPVDQPSPGGQGASTEMEFGTWFKSERPIPIGFALMAERMVLLRGAKAFLRTCELDKAGAQAILPNK